MNSLTLLCKHSSSRKCHINLKELYSLQYYSCLREALSLLIAFMELVLTKCLIKDGYYIEDIRDHTLTWAALGQ